LAFCALSLAATGILFSNYFGRNELSLNEIALNYGDVDSNIYPRSNIQFLSGDNTLQGYIYGETNGSGLIVIAHGIMSGADSYLAETMYFVDNGWIVFAFDGTGTRGSEGKGINGLPQTKLDLLAALSYIEQDEKLAELPVVLYGHSMGGYAVTSCLKDYTENIKTVICVSGFNSPLETMHYNVKSVVGFYANIEYPFIWIYQHFLFGKDANITAIDGINSVDIPILIVYGTEDDVVPYDEIGIYAYKECITNPNVSFLSIDEEGRNWHDNMHLSQKSGLYTQDIKDELSLLQQQFGNPLSDEMFFSFIESVDKAEMNSLHDAYMRNLWDFFNTAIS
jgi:pimeloyl-ACP methyl ester carboxylesterase